MIWVELFTTENEQYIGLHKLLNFIRIVEEIWL